MLFFTFSTLGADLNLQPSIVTCSGGGNTGTINVIRRGTDFEELAAIDGVRNVASTWPIRASYEDV
jgi:DNA damage-binding protein 1